MENQYEDLRDSVQSLIEAYNQLDEARQWVEKMKEKVAQEINNLNK